MRLGVNGLILLPIINLNGRLELNENTGELNIRQSQIVLFHVIANYFKIFSHSFFSQTTIERQRCKNP